MTTGPTGHEISPDVEAVVRQVDRAAEAMKAALAALSVVWHRPTTTDKERRVMHAARQRARRSGT